MTEANVLKLYNHFKGLSEGKFDEFTLDGKFSKLDREKGIPPERKALIISDAKKAIKAMETKRFPLHPRFGVNAGKLCYPFLTNSQEKEETQEENILEKIADNKKAKK